MSRFAFTSQNADSTTSLYVSDGTAAGTVNLDLSRFGFSRLGYPGSSDGDFTSFSGKLLFVGDGGSPSSGAAGSQNTFVYATDGSAGGTIQAAVTGMGGPLVASSLYVLGNKLLMSGMTQNGTGGLWTSSDGASFNEIVSGITSVNLMVSNGVGYFDNSADGQSLWRTDGTAAGTYSITPAGQALNPSGFNSASNGKTVFMNQGANGTALLWVTDGTAAGTHQVVNATLGTKVEFLGGSVGGKVLFTAIDAANNISTWATDGTSSGTVEVEIDGSASSPVRTPSRLLKSVGVCRSSGACAGPFGLVTS